MDLNTIAGMHTIYKLQEKKMSEKRTKMMRKKNDNVCKMIKIT